MPPILSSKLVVFVLGICLIVNIVTLALAIGSLYFEKPSYDHSCYSYGRCYAFYIIIPVMTLTFSFLGIILDIIQVILFIKGMLTRSLFFCLNLALTILWILVIAIGWAPENTYFDSSINHYAISVTGWFIAVSTNYKHYQELSSYLKNRYSQTAIAQLSFRMGLLIMSCIDFGIVSLITICALIGCISGNSKRTGNAAQLPVLSQQQWPGPTAYETKSPHPSANVQSEINYGGQRPVAVYPGT